MCDEECTDAEDKFNGILVFASVDNSDICEAARDEGNMIIWNLVLLTDQKSRICTWRPGLTELLLWILIELLSLFDPGWSSDSEFPWSGRRWSRRRRWLGRPSGSAMILWSRLRLLAGRRSDCTRICTSTGLWAIYVDDWGHSSEYL